MVVRNVPGTVFIAANNLTSLINAYMAEHISPFCCCRMFTSHTNMSRQFSSLTLYRSLRYTLLCFTSLVINLDARLCSLCLPKFGKRVNSLQLSLVLIKKSCLSGEKKMCDNSNISKPLEHILRQHVLCLIKVVLTLYFFFLHPITFSSCMPVLLQHFAILLKYVIHVAIPDIPTWVQEEMAKLDYQRREAFKVGDIAA